MSLDGYVADQNGNFDWAAPHEEVHSVVNELARDDGTYLYAICLSPPLSHKLPPHEAPTTEQSSEPPTEEWKP